MILRLALLLNILSPFGVAFLNAPQLARTKLTSSMNSPLYGKYDPYDEGSSRDDALGRNKARTDVRNFLTQRSIQSFVYLLNQVRDEQTVRFLEVRKY